MLLLIHFLAVAISTPVQISAFWMLHDHLAMLSLDKVSSFFLFDLKNTVALPSSGNVLVITFISQTFSHLIVAIGSSSDYRV